MPPEKLTMDVTAQYDPALSCSPLSGSAQIGLAQGRDPFIDRTEKVAYRMIDRLNEALASLESMERKLGVGANATGTLGDPEPMAPESGTSAAVDAALGKLEARIVSVVRLSATVANAL